MPCVPRRPAPRDSAELVDLLVETARSTPGVGHNQHTLAAALGISPRTLHRWLTKHHVGWPPLGGAEWQALLNQARAAQPETTPTWLVVCTVTAANLTELEARLGDVTMLRIERLSPDETDG